MNEAPSSLDPAATTAGAERREHERVSCRYLALCRSGGRAWFPVVFANLSAGGAAVLLSSPVEVDAALTFTIHAPQGRILLLRGRATRVEPHGVEWLTGCQFDRLLSDLEVADLM